MSKFLSTLSLRRATAQPENRIVQSTEFLSTLSLRRATHHPHHERGNQHISIHALLAESDANSQQEINNGHEFLSTLSLRRATHQEWSGSQQPRDFYPRSPCGERQDTPSTSIPNPDFYPRSPCGERHPPVTFPLFPFISIHALLAESDGYQRLYARPTTDFYPRSPCGERLHYDNYNLHCVEISIHALLAESDLRRLKNFPA